MIHQDSKSPNFLQILLSFTGVSLTSFNLYLSLRDTQIANFQTIDPILALIVCLALGLVGVLILPHLINSGMPHSQSNFVVALLSLFLIGSAVGVKVWAGDTPQTPTPTSPTTTSIPGESNPTLAQAECILTNIDIHQNPLNIRSKPLLEIGVPGFEALRHNQSIRAIGRTPTTWTNPWFLVIANEGTSSARLGWITGNSGYVSFNDAVLCNNLPRYQLREDDWK